MGTTKEEIYTEDQLRIAAVCKAIGHPARVAILQQLLADNCCICKDFAINIDLAQPTISRHLKELKEAGVIRGTIEGTRKSYCIHPGLYRHVAALIKQLLHAAGELEDGSGCC